MSRDARRVVGATVIERITTRPDPLKDSNEFMPELIDPTWRS